MMMMTYWGGGLYPYKIIGGTYLCYFAYATLSSCSNNNNNNISCLRYQEPREHSGVHQCKLAENAARKLHNKTDFKKNDRNRHKITYNAVAHVYGTQQETSCHRLR